MKDVIIKFENALKAWKNADHPGRKMISDLCGIDFTKQKSIDFLTSIKACVEACGKDYGVEFSTERTKWETPDETAYRQIKFITEAFNEGWVPDYSNSSEYKYYVWMKWVSGRGLAFVDVVCGIGDSTVGPRLVFKSEPLCRLAIERFPEVYDVFFNHKNQKG